MTTRTPVAFEQADENLAEMLDTLSGADNYLDFIAALMAPHLQGPILEIGAGMGDLTGRFASLHRVVATDLSARCLEHLDTRFSHDDRVAVAPYDAIAGGPVPGHGSSFGSAVMSNVLEHLPDDVAVLGNLAAQVVPGGTVAVFVPAFDLLYGRFDEQIGHHRRYRRAGLRDAFVAAGLDPVHVRYVNLPGWFAWLVTVRMAGMTPTGGAMVGAYDRFVIPAVRRIETRLSPPFGQSVLGIARVRSAPT